MADHTPQHAGEQPSTTDVPRSATQILAAFERRLQTSNQPQRAEEMPGLENVAPNDRRPLLFGMLQREIEHRQQHGHPLGRPEMEARFAEDRAIIDALFNQDREPVEITERLKEYEYLAPIHGNPYGGAYKVRHRATDETRVLWRISAFFVDAAGLSAERASADMVHLFHPNIAAPIELVQHRGDVYVISEYFAGDNFADFMATANSAPMPVPVVCEIFSQVARGLSGIHSFFKAHADVRPANVLIGTSGDDLGLVKLSGVAGGLVDEHQARFAHWPAGLRYAPAFCAPEISAGKQEPDPRSDVFSLGQLLYAALLGRPQTDGEKNPPLCRLRPDCPPALEAAIRQMTAEDPDERFESAGEVLPVLDKYAVHSQLVSWLNHRQRNPLLPAGGETDADSVVVFRVAASPTERRQMTTVPAPAPAHAHPHAPAPEKTRKPSEPLPVAPPTSAPKRPLLRRRSVLAIVGVLVLVAGGIAGVSLRNHWLPAASAAAPPPWAISLTELPGPNGDWWFEEMPWFTPEVRAELVRGVIADDPRLDQQQLQALTERLQSHPDYEAVNELHDIVKKVIRNMPTDVALVARQIDEIRPQAHTVGELKTEYGGIIEELQATESDRATTWHLRATLLQAHSSADEAAAAYERALSLYANAADPATTGLRALCAADYAQLLAEFERNYRKANTYYRLGIEQSHSPALEVICLCRLADSQRKWGRRAEALQTLTEARRLLQSDAGFLPEHPLNAVVAETQGWAALDTWQLEEARRAFEVAYEIRLAHSQSGNPRSWRAILWIEQGQAMTAHFRGDQQQAQEKYRKLLEQIDSSLKGGFIRDLPKQQRTELAARRPNLYERLADCYLFGAGIDHVQACQALTQAVQATEHSSFDSERLWPHILALKYKLAMALVLAGERDSAAAALRQADQELQNRQAEDNQISEGQQNVYESARSVAESLLQLESTAPDQRAAAIEALEKFHTAASSQVTRKNIDLVMLVTEELLKPALLPADNSARIVRRLDSIIQSLRTADTHGMTSLYLQRYCESGQRAMRNATSASVALTQPHAHSPITAVLAESMQKAPLAQRGLTRGSIEYDEAGKPVSCRLHVLTIGVSNYQHHQELQLACADDDAEALFEAYGQLCSNPDSPDSAGRLFQRGEFKKLTNEQATRGAIIEAINDMSYKATDKDLIIVSLSGHGTVDDVGNFYFLPSDYRDQSLRSTAIWDENLREMLTRGKSNAILVLDACHSGAATTTGTRAATAQQLQNAISRFTSSQKGLVVLAASLGSQTATENPRFGHGVLTLSLLEALQGRYNDAALAESKERGALIPPLPRAQDSSGLITLADIQYYIGSRVSGLTEGKQRATMNRLGGDLSMRDIPIRFQQDDSQ